jgi:hypothetical protein
MAVAAVSQPIIPSLEECQQRFVNARQEFRRLVYELDDGRFNWRPEPDRWSAAECIDHCVVVGTLMNRNIDDAIAKALERGLKSDGPYKYGALGNFFVKAVGPSDEARKRKFKAPKAYTPTSNHTISRLDAAFDKLQTDFVERLNRAKGLDLARIKVPSAAGGFGVLIRLSLGQWFALLANHQDRHLAQAFDVRNAMQAKGN